tara:strand:- start:861 stop:1397 length:537 start_codon:yes stop_codon:yes gene_type:complete
MPWVDGTYVPNRRADTTSEIVSTNVSTVVAPVELEESLIENDFFTESVVFNKFSTGSFTASVIKKLVPSGVVSVANGLRALFSPGFVNTELIENGAVTGAKMTNPIKVALINGGSAGVHTVTGIKIEDELICVLEQNGTSGLLTDLTSEFSIIKADTITNVGGTATSSDKLVVLYLSK